MSTNGRYRNTVKCKYLVLTVELFEVCVIGQKPRGLLAHLSNKVKRFQDMNGVEKICSLGAISRNELHKPSHLFIQKIPCVRQSDNLILGKELIG